MAEKYAILSASKYDITENVIKLIYNEQCQAHLKRNKHMNPEAMATMEVEVTLQEKLAEVDATIEMYKAQLDIGEAIQRLEANPDYLAVIAKGYFEAEAERITGLIVGIDQLRREQMENIIEAALAIRNFKQYLRYKKLDAGQAAHNIDETVAYRKHLTEEYAEDGSYINAEEV
jgi:hypothetical protein